MGHTGCPAAAYGGRQDMDSETHPDAAFKIRISQVPVELARYLARQLFASHLLKLP